MHAMKLLLACQVKNGVCVGGRFLNTLSRSISQWCFACRHRSEKDHREQSRDRSVDRPHFHKIWLLEGCNEDETHCLVSQLQDH